MNFRIKEKFILRISGGKGDIFQRRKLIEIRDLHNVLRTEKVIFQSSKKRKNKTKQNKKQSVWYFIYHGISFTGCYRALVLNFLGMENTVFFEPKFWWKYDIYWYLKNSCFEIFGNGKYSLFLRQKVDGKMTFTHYSKALALNFLVMGNTVFF